MEEYDNEPEWKVCEHEDCDTLFDITKDPTDPKSDWRVLAGMAGQRRLPFKKTKFTQEQLETAARNDEIYYFCKKCFDLIYAEILGNKFINKETLNLMVKVPHGDRKA